jgi:hypothetical protein
VSCGKEEPDVEKISSFDCQQLAKKVDAYSYNSTDSACRIYMAKGDDEFYLELNSVALINGAKAGFALRNNINTRADFVKCINESGTGLTFDEEVEIRYKCKKRTNYEDYY